MSYTISDSEALLNRNVQKALALIGKYESANDYKIIYRPASSDPRFDPSLPTHFSDYSAHPNIRVPFTTADGRPEISTAAGKYQINHPTWLVIQTARAARGKMLPDFSPGSQDIAAIELLRMEGILQAIMNGDWLAAMPGMSRRWASMPLDNTGQSHLSMNDALEQLTA